MTFEEWWDEIEPVYSDEYLNHFGFDHPREKKILKWAWEQCLKYNKEEE